MKPYPENKEEFKKARQEQIKNQGPITKRHIEALNNSRKYGKKVN